MKNNSDIRAAVSGIMRLTLCLAFFAAMTSCQDVVKKGLDVVSNKAIASLDGFDYTDSEKLGPVVTRDVEVSTLTSLATAGANKIIFKQDSLSSLKLTGNEKMIDKYEVMVENGELIVRLTDDRGNYNSNTPRMTISVSGPSLEEVMLEGIVDFEVEGNIVQEAPMNVYISGVGKFEADEITCGSFDLSLSGIANAEIDKIVSKGNSGIDIKGTGSVEGSIDCVDLRLKTEGTGSMDLDVNCEYLRTFNTGIGNITLRGSCYKLVDSSSKSSIMDTSELEIEN